MPADRTLLVTVTGRDRPGVTSALFGALAGADIEVVDVEQVVIRGRLVLGVLVSVGDDEAKVRAPRDQPRGGGGSRRWGD